MIDLWSLMEVCGGGKNRREKNRCAVIMRSELCVSGTMHVNFGAWLVYGP